MSALFKFAHLSDSHIRPDAPGQSQVFVDHLAQIEAGDYAFVIHTGDLMEEPSAWAARAFRTMASTLSIPIYAVPGNHDVYNPHFGEVEAPWWARLAVDSRLEAQYRTWFGPNWYAFSYQGVGFVAFDSLIVNSGLPEEAAQWGWLEGTLAELAARKPDHLVLFTHLPPTKQPSGIWRGWGEGGDVESARPYSASALQDRFASFRTPSYRTSPI